MVSEDQRPLLLTLQVCLLLLDGAQDGLLLSAAELEEHLDLGIVARAQAAVPSPGRPWASALCLALGAGAQHLVEGIGSAERSAPP